MTVAVCLKCGEFKFGTFTPCPKCQYMPNDNESLTKHLLVSDHYHDSDSLKSIADRVKAGQTIEFDPDSLQAAWVSKKDMDKQIGKLKGGCNFILVIAAILLTAVIALAIGLFS